MNMEIDKDLVRRRLSRAHGGLDVRIYAYLAFVLAVAVIVVAIAIGGYNPK